MCVSYALITSKILQCNEDQREVFDDHLLKMNRKFRSMKWTIHECFRRLASHFNSDAEEESRFHDDVTVALGSIDLFSSSRAD